MVGQLWELALPFALAGPAVGLQLGPQTGDDTDLASLPADPRVGAIGTAGVMRHATVVEGVGALRRCCEEDVPAFAGTDLNAVRRLTLCTLRHIPRIATEHVDLEPGEHDGVIEETEVGEANEDTLSRRALHEGAQRVAEQSRLVAGEIVDRGENRIPVTVDSPVALSAELALGIAHAVGLERVGVRPAVHRPEVGVEVRPVGGLNVSVAEMGSGVDLAQHDRELAVVTRLPVD